MAEPTAAHDTARCCDFRRREGSQADRPGVLRAAEGARPTPAGNRDCAAACWVIPPKANSAFVAAMEDVLAVYTTTEGRASGLGKAASRSRPGIAARKRAKAGATDWIIQALDTSASMIYRVRKQLVEEGFEAVLSRKRAGRCACWRARSWNSALSRRKRLNDRAHTQKNCLKPHRRQSTRCRDAHANPDETRTCSPHRLRVRA